MQAKEAILRIKDHNRAHQRKERFAVKITEALDLAVSALEKQTPKKVNNFSEDGDISACIPKTKSGNCPICNNFIWGAAVYCDKCGQALDWSAPSL